MKQRLAILITGTIVPNSSFVAVTDPQTRLQEYMEALRYYRQHFPDTDIYFLENSSFDLGSDLAFQQLINIEKIVVMRFAKSEMVNKGKGYQEFQMLDEAVDRLSGKYDAAAKVTGRYRVTNLRRLNEGIIETLRIDCHRKPQVAQTNVFCFQFDYYLKHIKGLYRQADDEKGEFIEKVIYLILREKRLIRETKLFTVSPRITGISGSYGTPVGRNKWKMKFLDLERKCLSLMNINEFPFEI